MAYYFERRNDVCDVVDLTEKEGGGTTVIIPRLGEREWSAWRTNRSSVALFLTDKAKDGEFILFDRTVNGVSLTGALCSTALQGFTCQSRGGSVIGQTGIYSVYSLGDNWQKDVILEDLNKAEKFRHSRTAVLIRRRNLYGLYVHGSSAPQSFTYSRQHKLYVADVKDVDRDELESFMSTSDIRPPGRYVPYSVAEGTEKILQEPDSHIISLVTGGA